MALIRKISVGPDYKDAMHYSVGQFVLKGSHTIEGIKLNDDGAYQVWICNNRDEVVLWKEYKNMPVSVELSINF